MQIIRNRFGRLVQRVFGGFSDGVQAAGNRGDAAAATKGWIALTIGVVAASVALCYFVKTGLGVEVILAIGWGLFIGFSMLIFWPPKLLTTIFGGTLGVAGTGLPGVGDTIEKLAKEVEKIVTTLNASLAGAYQVHSISVILFLVAMAICMLPAYRTSDE
ncbi:hypothetical protein [Paraburkholderia phosphatilytica]|uniref:hypothetical protein n=1 Tax=Paraburkholderia phosphatilytica TaxID=2282883 RepID=UPI0013E0302D|nr:hypothetical protein [Paraburkholderia phosphatilytica]